MRNQFDIKQVSMEEAQEQKLHKEKAKQNERKRFEWTRVELNTLSQTKADTALCEFKFSEML